MKIAHVRKRGKHYVMMNLKIDGERRLIALSRSEIDSALFRAEKWQKNEQLKKVL